MDIASNQGTKVPLNLEWWDLEDHHNQQLIFKLEWFALLFLPLQNAASYYLYPDRKQPEKVSLQEIFFFPCRTQSRVGISIQATGAAAICDGRDQP